MISKKKKRILLITNVPLSNSTSGGRTLLNMLGLFQKDQLFNIFLHGIPLDDAANFYQFSDRMAVKSLWKKQKISLFLKKEKPGDCSNAGTTSTKKRKKTAFLAWTREIIWSNRNVKKAFIDLAKQISPDLIFVIMGDSGFLLNLAKIISLSLSIPIITFNSEDYFFKDYDYFKKNLKPSFFYNLFIKKFRKSLTSLYEISSFDFFLTDDLKLAYQNVFRKKKTKALYTASELADAPIIQNTNPDNFVFSYLGSLGFGRLDVLLTLANELQRIDKKYILDIYTEDVCLSLIAKANKEHPRNIRVNTFVSYSKVLSIMKTSFALVHVDGLDRFNAELTKRGFSTKIADSLSSGNCFIVFSPKDSTASNYVRNNECAFLAGNIEELRKDLAEITSSPLMRMRYVRRAIDIAKKNHSREKNSKVFYTIVIDALGNIND